VRLFQNPGLEGRLYDIDPNTAGDNTGTGGNTGPSIPGGSALDAISKYIPLLGTILGTAGNVYGALNQQKAQDFLQGGKVNVLDYLNAMGNSAKGNSGAIQPGLLAALTGAQDRGNDWFNYNQGKGSGWLDQGLFGLNDFYSRFDPNSIPGLSGVFGQTGGLTGATNTALQTAQDIAQGNAQSMAPLFTQGKGLLEGAANDPFANLLKQYAAGSLTRGGYTPELQGINATGQSLLQPGAAGAGGALDLANNIFSGGKPVLPIQQALDMVRNQTATDAKNQTNALRRQMLNRTGVTGPAVASGQENELFSGLEDSQLQAQSKAMTDTMLGQQGLGLQQLAQGGNLFNAGTGANLGYTGQGLNAQLQAASQAGNLQQILGQLGLGGGNLGLQQASTGGNLLNSFNQTALGGLGASNSLLGTGIGGQKSIADMLFQSQGLGQTQSKNYQDALQGLLASLNTQNGQALSQAQGGSQGLGNLLSQYINQYTSSGTAQPALFSGNIQPSNIWQQVLSGLGGGGSGGSKGIGINFGFDPNNGISIGGGIGGF